jgi:hypothetical protein
MYVLLGLLILTRLVARRWTAALSAERSVKKAGAGDEDVSPDGLALEIGERVAVRDRSAHVAQGLGARRFSSTGS